MSYEEVIIKGNRMTITEEKANDGGTCYHVGDPGFGPDHVYHPQHDDLSELPDHVQRGIEQFMEQR